MWVKMNIETNTDTIQQSHLKKKTQNILNIDTCTVYMGPIQN